MKKTIPTVTVNMSLAQDDMNRLLRNKTLKNQVTKQHQISKDEIDYAAYLLSLDNSKGVGIDIALGVGNYLYLNMSKKCFCASEEALDNQTAHKPGYKRAVALNAYMSLIAAGGFFSAQQAIGQAYRLIISELIEP